MDVKREPLDVDKLMKLLSLKIRKDAIKALLAGNDTQCFTTQQYREAYCRQGCMNGTTPDFFDRVIGHDWARNNLKELPSLVKEVKPDVWAAVEMQGWPLEEVCATKGDR